MSHLIWSLTIELILNCPIKIRFAFSSLRFRKVTVVLLLLPFSQLLSFVSWKERVDFSGWFLLQWFNFWKLLWWELTDVTLLWYPGFPRLPNLDHSFLIAALRLSANLAVPWGLRCSPLPPRCLLPMLRFLTMSMLSSSNKLQRWWLVRIVFPLSERKVGCEIITLHDLRASRIFYCNRKVLSSISRAVKFVALLVPTWRKI